MNTLSALKAYGLNEHESAVYMRVVTHLEANVTQIERGTLIPRATIYKALEKLEEHNLISKFKKNKVLHVTPTSINQLEKNLESKLDGIRMVIPDLRSMVNTAERASGLEFSVGVDNVKAVYEKMFEIMRSHNEKTLYIISGGNSHTLMRDYLDNWKRRVSKERITTKIIRPRKSLPYSRKVTIPNIERRYYPDSYDFGGSVHIFSGHIVLVTFNPKKPQATLIASDDMNFMMKNIWNLLWNVSKEEI
jgi:sugar-specific transcriptional regulator TrmB